MRMPVHTGKRWIRKKYITNWLEYPSDGLKAIRWGIADYLKAIRWETHHPSHYINFPFKQDTKFFVHAFFYLF
jgi:hypothetical protein